MPCGDELGSLLEDVLDGALLLEGVLDGALVLEEERSGVVLLWSKLELEPLLWPVLELVIDFVLETVLDPMSDSYDEVGSEWDDDDSG